MQYQYYNPYQNQYMIPNQYSNQYQYHQQHQMPIMQQQPQINGQLVDGIDAVRVKDVDLTGNPVFYPNVNGNEIYMKQLLSDGTSRITTYVLDTNHSDNKQYIDEEQLNRIIGKFKSEIIEEIKQMIG